MRDIGDPTGPPQRHPPNATTVTTAVANHETVPSAEEDSMGEDERSSAVAQWQRFILNNVLGGNLPPFAPTERGDMLDTLPAAATPWDQSPTAVSSEEGGGETATCTCLKRLTDHLCHLNVIERKQNTICIDTTLSETDTTLSCAESVLECHFCRLDSKLMLLVMTVLQTVLNWVNMEYRQKTHGRQLTPVHFGHWKVPKADGHLIEVLLTNRILATSDSVVRTLRLRMDEITLKASKQDMSYRFMDAEFLQQALQRLASSLQELAEYVKS